MLSQQQTDFLQYLRYEKRYSPHTVTAYQTDLLQFSAYLQEQFNIIEVADIALFHIRSWLAGMKDSKQTPRTINRKLSSLNSLYRYMLRQQVVDKNPVKLLHAQRLPERLPAALKETETQFLLEEVQFPEGFKGATHRMVCDLLYQTGMRRQELVQLKEQDIEWSLEQLRILGKGNKERLVPINPMLSAALKDYIKAKEDVPDADRSRLLVTDAGRPIYAGYVYIVVRKYLGDITTQKKKSPHVLRHSFATHLLNNGANIQAIKDLLGHSSLAATQIYTHNNIKKLKDIHKQNHPRG